MSQIFSNFALSFKALLIMNTESSIRFYGRTELARLYSPFTTDRTAWRRLQALIAATPGLSDGLARLGYTSRQRTFTPQQAALIFATIGAHKVPVTL
jgi:hypothetical protein